MPVAVACLLQRDIVVLPAPPSRCWRLARIYLTNHVFSNDALVIEFDAGGVPLYFSERPATLKRGGTILCGIYVA
ncbi:MULTISPECIES: hypothetical protein [Paraburkholderia]|uniref:hypothetical protein n=1 Tax=Paraburkholderia TaxID=1822464 RepID=UPI0038BDBFA3